MKRSIQIASLESCNPRMRVIIDLRYRIGGINWFSGGDVQRGYWLGIQPTTVAEDGGMSYVPTDGYIVFIQPASKFSQRVLEERGAQLQRNMHTLDNIWPVVESSLRKIREDYEEGVKLVTAADVVALG